jgi:hypothetical protein
MKREHALLAMATLFGVLLHSCSYRGASGQPAFENLTAQNVADVKIAFNAAKNQVRVLLLFSPT